jgi:carbamoyltransferase
MSILGINAFHGDASAALFQNGQLVAAVEQERFNRIKHCAGFPDLAIASCLRNMDPASVAHVAISRDPWANLLHKALFVARSPARWGMVATRLRNSLRISRAGCDLASFGLPASAKLHHVEHHRAHLASAFFASPFEEAAVVSIDGSGDFTCAMWAVGRGNRLKVLGSVLYPHSLGFFYTCFTQYLGFHKYGDEYKMMGLSAYGEPRYKREVAGMIATHDGRCRLNLDYLVHVTKDGEMTWDEGEPRMGMMFSEKLVELFGPPRSPRGELEPRHADLAASVQAVLEENYFGLLNHVARVTGQKKVCLAGGVALNCVANGMILEKTPFTDVYIQPASNDCGTAIGAALYVQHQILGRPRSFVMRHVYYGPEYSEVEIRAELDAAGAVYQRLETSELLDETARDIAGGKIVGWYQGRMEFGPRALGNRSILADPRRKDMKDILNRRIKYREPFRPFCPSILAERTGEYFEIDYPSPFMVMAYKIRPEQRERIPAVTHGDGTGRLQTVERDVNPLYWSLIKRFEEMTGVPVLLNTSFNENEPIVNTPREALECFLRTQMDVLVMGPFHLRKAENSGLAERRKAFAEAGSV